MRKYFSLAKRFPFQMFFIILGLVLVLSGTVFAYIEENPFAEQVYSFASVLILIGIVFIVLAARNIKKHLLRQLEKHLRYYREYHYQKVWQGLN